MSIKHIITIHSGNVSALITFALGRGRKEWLFLPSPLEGSSSLHEMYLLTTLRAVHDSRVTTWDMRFWDNSILNSLFQNSDHHHVGSDDFAWEGKSPRSHPTFQKLTCVGSTVRFAEIQHGTQTLRRDAHQIFKQMLHGTLQSWFICWFSPHQIAYSAPREQPLGDF